MNNGKVKVRDMEGQYVEFDAETARHVGDDHTKLKPGTNITDGEDRLQHLVDAIRTVRTPHEIWEELDSNGNPTAKIYLRVYSYPVSGKSTNQSVAMLGVRWESESHRLHTYYYNEKPDKLERKRKGRLLYKRK